MRSADRSALLKLGVSLSILCTMSPSAAHAQRVITDIRPVGEAVAVSPLTRAVREHVQLQQGLVLQGVRAQLVSVGGQTARVKLSGQDQNGAFGADLVIQSNDDRMTSASLGGLVGIAVGLVNAVRSAVDATTGAGGAVGGGASGSGGGSSSCTITIINNGGTINIGGDLNAGCSRPT